MAKFTATPLASSYGSVNAINANLQAIETAFQNTVSRDGSTPNTMSANLDMNGFSIVNAGNVGYGQTVPTVAVNTTLALTNAANYINASSASPIVITIPLEATVAFNVGTRIDVARMGTGTVTFAATAGVTLTSRSGLLSISAQYGEAHLTKIAADTWQLAGDLA